MSLFVDKVISRDNSAIQVDMCWHESLHLIALAAYSEDKGGTVEVVDQFGYFTDADEGHIPPHPTAQTSALAWHPTKKILLIAWDSGELYLYVIDQCMKVDAAHSAAVNLAQWSSRGSCLITADKNGAVIGWKSDGHTRLDVIFHHELKDSLTSLTFCRPVSGGGGGGSHHADPTLSNLTGLARAAVAGDERALDLFSSWNPAASGRRSSTREVNNAYAGSNNGVIYFLNENGSCMEVLQADGAVKKLLMTDKVLVVITENMIIGQFHLETDGGLREVSRVKLSTKMKENQIAWVEPRHLAISSGELSVRMWNLETDNNFVLTQDESDLGGSGGQQQFLTSLAYCQDNQTLAAGTNSGHVVMWQTSSNLAAAVSAYDLDSTDEESAWKNLSPIEIDSAIRKITWGANGNVLALNSIRQVFFLNEQERAVAAHKGTTVVQMSPTDLNVTFPASSSMLKSAAPKPVRLTTSVSIEKVRLSEFALVAYGHGKVISYELQHELEHMLSIGNFDLFCDDIATHDQSVCTLEANRINVRSFQGTIKQTLILPDAEGVGEAISVHGKFLLLLTKEAVVKIWDMSKREFRLHIHPVNLKEKIEDFCAVSDIGLNSTGSRLTVCCSNLKSESSLSSFLYVIDFDTNFATYFNFNSGRNERDDTSVPPNSAQSNSSHSSQGGDGVNHRSRISGRSVGKHAWDEVEPNFLVCQVRDVVGRNEPDAFVSMFFHDEIGLIVHDTRDETPDSGNKLVGAAIPFFYVYEDGAAAAGANNKEEQGSGSVTASGTKSGGGGGGRIRKLLMKDFEGLESSDKATREAVVNFCFYLSIGNMDEAFRAIKMITNKKVWGNLARMCVKSQRLDVATICLGKMEHSTGARAMRKIMPSKVSKDIKLAILAIYLNMHEEAENILIRCNQHELLNKFYQDSDNWQKALSVAEKLDRIHLRSTYYNYAKHLESKYDIGGAIAYYEKSGTSRFEVPRILFEDWNALESYVDRSEDKSLKRWLAQYLESTGEMDVALQYYELAEDYLSLVRVYCYCENLEKAAEIANSSGNKAACYHLARQYENMDDVPNAIHFFSKAQAYSNAIRICKEQRYDDHVWNLALLASDNEKLDAAKFFEKNDRPQYDKAVILYEKAGYFGKALELAISTNQHNALLQITKQLKTVTDPYLSAKAANFFLENKQYEKAVELFVSSRQCEKALELCLQYNITITEENAEKLALDENGKVNNDLLNQVASVAYRQGNYHLATKKWTQAGNRLQAMKALLKSGDTEKIIFFANVSRDRDIYILAGNYLQTLDWRNNADIMKSIILFYQKSKAFDLLGWFYVSCAEVEIDEYQNYEKAMGALSECMTCLEKSGDASSSKGAEVNRQLELVARFVEAQKVYDRNAENSMKICQELLREQNINAAVRKGDIYGFLIEHYAKVQNFRGAQQMIDELRRNIPNVNLAYYVNSDTLLSIEKALGVKLLPENNRDQEEL